MTTLSDRNCSKCFKRFDFNELTIIVIPEENIIARLCEKCLERFKELTKNEKVCVEVSDGGTSLYCYRCGLKTKDKELFKKHNCIKTEQSIKFIETLINDDQNE